MNTFEYCIVTSSNMHYLLGNQLFVKRSQYIRIKNPLLRNLKKPAFASKRDMLELATLQ